MSRSHEKSRFVIAYWLMALVVGLAACGKGEAITQNRENDHLILASKQELGNFNPIAGYSELGASPLYDGLLRLKSESPDKLPVFEAALASNMPTSNADFTQWTVKLRDGVKFHDGSTLDAQDVVKTYEAILDPASASPISASLEMIDHLTADTQSDVTFYLRYGYSDFQTRMLIGIAPAEKLNGGLVERSELNRTPVGTGPFRLVRLSAERAKFQANDEYWAGAPTIKKLTLVYLADDNARAQRMKTGEFDGTILPPQLAKTFEGSSDVRVVSAKTADWRGISFPATNSFTQDKRARIAMNIGVDRRAMLDSILAGKGQLAYTPASSVYGDAYSSQAAFAFDKERAKSILDEAGWRTEDNGIRKKGADAARFTIAYKPEDMLRRDLAMAFSADMKTLGIDVNLEALPFSKLESRIDELGVVLGGGDRPYSVDTQLYGPLHRKIAGTSVWDNPGNYGNADRDMLLETGRKTSDSIKRAEIYRQVQESYITDPSYIFLVFLDHTYAMKKNNNVSAVSMIVEPHEHGVTWGPWWNVASWGR